MTTSFDLTPKQVEANRLLGGPQTHTMLFGGSRSGKTFLIVRAYCVRAIKYAGARQAMFRFRFNAIRSSVVADTFPKVMKLCFPDVSWKLDKTEWIAKFTNGSEIWFGGLDDKERTEKILGQEHCGIYLNECSQIPWSGRNMALTRLAQNCGAKLRMDYDCNPPSQAHWTYKVFIQKLDPETGGQLPRPGNFQSMLMNPTDNRANLTEEYLDELDSLPERLRKRFVKGEFLPAAPNALWSTDVLDRQRVIDADLPDMQRVVVAVDPSGADEEHPDRDEIGIVVAALGTDGIGYILEDLTINAGPAKWGKIVASAFDRHSADLVVGEENFGGAMVKFVVQTARPNTPYKSVHASRGKVVRAEPVAALYGDLPKDEIGDERTQNFGKVRHVGFFPELEDEMCAFTTTGYTGDGSPNRADAAIWGLTELFPGIAKGEVKLNIPPPSVRPAPMMGRNSWMG